MCWEAPALFEFIAQTMTARATTLGSPDIFGGRHFPTRRS